MVSPSILSQLPLLYDLHSKIQILKRKNYTTKESPVQTLHKAANAANKHKNREKKKKTEQLDYNIESRN
jgi:hypothetical protein